MKIYNTMNRRKEEFVPLRDNKVGMYVCGVTVYDYCHIGHARSMLVFDMIYRYLLKKGYEVTYVRNFTDVDDKIIKKANEEGVSPKEIAERYIQAFYEDIDALGALRPTVEPKATEHIQDMIDLIKRLEDKGIAYQADGDVYYQVRKFPAYGKLSGRSLEEMMAGARIEVDEKKKDPLDFALWKASKPGEPWWESPWGKGRPGWHIECSAMSMKYLGETFDIHGGGMDLIFPHHENEIAQSEGATGKPFVRYWIHNGFVNINKEKMSKSLGNIILIRDILNRWDAEVLRLFLLKTHYRTPIDFTFDIMDQEKESLDRLYRTKEKVEDLISVKSSTEPQQEAKNVAAELSKLREEFFSAMDDDFNTALALGKFYEAARLFNRFVDKSGASESDKAFVAKEIESFVKDIQDVFGILNYRASEWFKVPTDSLSIPQDEIERLIKERAEARKEKNFKKADEIRDYLKSKGIILEDRPDGTTTWKLQG
ncbi:cysteinyl-tRNA synthetase [Thermosulfidibacter takaii ABI70S6]|uniref:Cysteine--tRNA ligase n=1 Tax=Thermosulfidibacter takaii (strain DSM 17441 / JCM 13301 / NBRC 103674 / ABI70S6) TaxID=1298851 RepID=A0A0S3QTK1_THET7|nr:cysteine--tRNA ligase [Thermosulfidibacter takaii]BAT71659.1 cysteinyl-tRNA synthetase [Thermosulfidibacter takaii ABI70S6]